MLKKDFIALGLDEDLAAKCEEESKKELKGFVTRERFNEVAGERDTLKESLKERDAQLETIKQSNADVEKLKTQIETLQTENKAKDKAHEAELKRLKIDSAVEAAITGAKGKNAKAIKALLNLESAELLEDGTVKGLKEQLEALAKAEDSVFLFDVDVQPQVKGATPAGNAKNRSAEVTREAFAKMGYKERVELFNNNRELYDQLVKE